LPLRLQCLGRSIRFELHFVVLFYTDWFNIWLRQFAAGLRSALDAVPEDQDGDPSMKRTFLKFAAAAAVLAVVSACGGSDDDDDDGPTGPGNIVQVATSNGFTSLVAAVKKAELETALSDSAAALTVFAPTDAAFTALATALGDADANAMVTRLTKEQLAAILTYHVLPIKVESKDIPSGTPVATVNTATITITVATSPPPIATIADTTSTPAAITAVDVQASNGVIHVIDKVLIPAGNFGPT
jgi:uncharacterized surface protein with fasciclin (FAS1) repeats